jgi:hypothetical protein
MTADPQYRPLLVNLHREQYESTITHTELTAKGAQLDCKFRTGNIELDSDLDARLSLQKLLGNRALQKRKPAED